MPNHKSLGSSLILLLSKTNKLPPLVSYTSNPPKIFSQESVDASEMGTVIHRLRRVTEIQRVLIDQLTVLETMTPLDFLDFRDYLFPASGFQSVQFRKIENTLGLDSERRLRYSGKSYCSYLTSSSWERVFKPKSSLI